MKAKVRIAALLAAASALPVAAATQDDIFWKELQRTDGYQESSVSPVHRGTTTSVTVRDSAAAQYFDIERQKTDGYVAGADVEAPVMKAEAK